MFYSVFFFFWLVVSFALARPFFMLYTGAVGQGAGLGDFADVVLHGFPHDLCVASALALPIWLCSLAVLPWRLWHGWQPLPRPWQVRGHRLLTAYIALVSVAVAVVLVSDAALYPFWDIKLDATVLAYLDSPRGALNSVSPLFVAAYLSATVLVALVVGCPLRAVARRSALPPRCPRPLSPVAAGYRMGFALFWGACLLLSLRGVQRLWASRADDAPISVATAYYSPRQVLNHAAVNPLFSFFSSVGNRACGISPDTFMPDAEARRAFAQLNYNTASHLAPADTLVSAGCRQVVLIIMEGCGGTLVGNLCGRWDDITPCLNRLCDESVNFSQCYANSFRTDRGLVSILSGYPAFPDISVMRHADRCGRLPGIARSLRRAGYATDFLYGGDRDFTRMAGYLQQVGYEHVWGDRDFPEGQRRTHQWGVTDSITFARLAQLTTAPIDASRRGRFVTFLTLASHEPWEVPYRRMLRRGKIANSFAYLDHCLDAYLQRLRRSPLWRETLVVLVADHGIAWPDAISELNPDRYHIPLLWTGGAARSPRKVATLCNQSDLAATLLGQLGVEHGDFPFSRDVLSQSYTVPCAQHSWADGFTFIDSTGHTIVDIHTRRVVSSVSVGGSDSLATRRRETSAKAFMQTAYRHLEER